MTNLIERFPALAKIVNDHDPKRDARVNAAIERALALEVPKLKPVDNIPPEVIPLIGLI